MLTPKTRTSATRLPKMDPWRPPPIKRVLGRGRSLNRGMSKTDRLFPKLTTALGSRNGRNESKAYLTPPPRSNLLPTHDRDKSD